MLASTITMISHDHNSQSHSQASYSFLSPGNETNQLLWLAQWPWQTLYSSEGDHDLPFSHDLIRLIFLTPILRVPSFKYPKEHTLQIGSQMLSCGMLPWEARETTRLSRLGTQTSRATNDVTVTLSHKEVLPGFPFQSSFCTAARQTGSRLMLLIIQCV